MLYTRKIISLAAYFIIATSLAAFVRLGLIDPFNARENGFLAGLLNSVIFIGWTPAIAAFAIWRLFGAEDRKSSWVGNSLNASWMIALVPAIVLSVYGVPNKMDVSPRIFGGILGLLLVFYALGEEIGWRGFMHDRLAPNPIWLRALIITLPWYLWHLPFSGGEFDLMIVIKFTGILGLTSLILSHLSEESRSWVMLAGFHSIGNIGFMGNAVNLPARERLILAGISLVVMLIIYHWQKPSFKKSSLPV